MPHIKAYLTWRNTVIGAALVFLFLFVLMPLAILVWKSFFGTEGDFSLQNYLAVYSKRRNWDAVVMTVVVCGLTMLFAVIFATGLAWLVVRSDLPFKRQFRSMFFMPYMIPPYVGAIAWILLLTPGVGYVNVILVKYLGFAAPGPLNIYSLTGLVWVMTLFYYPLAFLNVASALEQMDNSLEEAARISGAGPLRVIWDITLPLAAPNFFAGGLLVFAAAASAFGIPAIVGMPSRIYVLSTQVMTYVYMGTPAGMREAIALSVVLMVLAIITMTAGNRILARRKYTLVGGKSARVQAVSLGRLKPVALAAAVLLSGILVILPVGAIVLTSFVNIFGQPLEPGNFTLSHYKYILTFKMAQEAFRNSFVMGAAAATLALLLASLIAYYRVKARSRLAEVSDLIATVPYATPGTVIALALIIVFSGKFGLNLYNTMAILVLAYLIKYLAFAVRTISASLEQIDLSLEEAAQISGASWLQSFKDIILPLVRPGLIAAWFLVFMACFYELTMTILLYGPQTHNLGVVLYELQTYSNQQAASVLSVLILIVVLGGNLVVARVTKGKIGI
ncbi:MAG: iron ABC transporter permease [Burkholderiales bacterium]|nr:iron ABC transporter permease [Burkholderiales bacterium]